MNCLSEWNGSDAPDKGESVCLVIVIVVQLR